MDFCYVSNLLLLISAWLRPHDQVLFQIVFAFSNGPIAFAVAAWRNSLVFHSLDKMTSLVIHLGPVLATYALRHSTPAWPYLHGYADQSFAEQCHVMLGLAIGAYCSWQLAYFLKVQVVDREKITRYNRDATNTKKYVTSFTHLRSLQNTALGRIINSAPHSLQPAAFAFVQLNYTVITLLPTLLFFRFQYLHLAWLLALTFVSSWNAANYYVEVFASRYEKELKELEATAVDLKSVSRHLSRSPPSDSLASGSTSPLGSVAAFPPAPIGTDDKD